MNQTMTESHQPQYSKTWRFGVLLAAAVILYIVAVMVFIVVY